MYGNLLSNYIYNPRDFKYRITQPSVCQSKQPSGRTKEKNDSLSRPLRKRGIKKEFSLQVATLYRWGAVSQVGVAKGETGFRERQIEVRLLLVLVLLCAIQCMNAVEVFALNQIRVVRMRFLQPLRRNFVRLTLRLLCWDFNAIWDSNRVS